MTRPLDPGFAALLPTTAAIYRHLGAWQEAGADRGQARPPAPPQTAHKGPFMTPDATICQLERRLAPRLPPDIRRSDLARFAAALRRAGVEHMPELAPLYEALRGPVQARAKHLAAAEEALRWDLAQLEAEFVGKADDLSRHHLLGDLAFDALSRWLLGAQDQAQQPAWHTLTTALEGLKFYRDSGRLSGTIEMFLRSMRADEMARMLAAVARQAPPTETSQGDQGSVIARYLSRYAAHRLPDPDDPDKLFAFQRGHYYRLLLEPEIHAAAALRIGSDERLDVETSARLAAEQLAAEYGGRMHQIGDLAGHDADSYLEDDLSRRRRRRAHEAADRRRPPRDALILAWVALEGARHDQWMRLVQEAEPVGKALAYTSDIKPGDEASAAGHLADIEKVFGAAMRLPDTPDVLATARASIMEQYQTAQRLPGVESVIAMELAPDTERHLLRFRDNMERDVGAGRKGRPNPVGEMRNALELASWVERLAEIYERPDFLPYAQSLRARASKPKALKKLPAEERTTAAPAFAAYVTALVAPTYAAKSAALAEVATPVCDLVEQLRKSPKHPTLPALEELCRLVVAALDYYSQAAQAQAQGALATPVTFDHPSYALSPEYYRGGIGQAQYVVDVWRPFPVHDPHAWGSDYGYIVEREGRWHLHKAGEQDPSYATPQDAAWAYLGKRLDVDRLRLLLQPPPARLPDADRLLVRVTAIAPDLLDDEHKRARDRLITRLRAGALGRDPVELAYAERELFADLARAAPHA